MSGHFRDDVHHRERRTSERAMGRSRFSRPAELGQRQEGPLRHVAFLTTRGRYEKVKGDIHMKKIIIIIAIISATISISAQRGGGGGPKINTTTKMEYHNGPIMSGASAVYVVWYGCWQSDCGNMGSPATVDVVEQFTSSIG